MIAYTHYPSDPRVRREAETLVSTQDYDVTFIVPKIQSRSREYIMDGVNVIELNALQYRGKSQKRYILSYLNFLARAFFACTKLFVTRRIDLFHVHNMPNFLVLSCLIPRLFGKKIILDMHDPVPELFAVKFNSTKKVLFKLLCWEEFLCSRFVHHIICVNHVQREAIVSRGIPESKISISMNVPDHKRFNSNGNNNAEKKVSQKFKLVYHGTLVHRLGIDLTIHAVARLLNNIRNLDFEIIGSGDDSDDLIRLVNSLKIGDHVHICDYVPVEKLPMRLSHMDIGVVSNRNNIATELMLPVKMLEYVVLNIPVVAPRIRAIQYYFDEDMVSYFEPENVNSLAKAISELYHDVAKREKQVQTARKFIEKYGWENHQSDLINLYENLSNGRAESTPLT